MNFETFKKTLKEQKIPVILPKTNKVFNWTKESYNELLVGDEKTGVGGANYDDIIATYGKADTDTKAILLTRRIRTLTYSTINKTPCTVSLTFTKQEDGSYLLSKKSQIGLDN